MHPLLRWGVVGLAVAGAFAGGYFVRNLPSRMTAAAETSPPAVAAGPQKGASVGTAISRATVTVRHTELARPTTVAVPVQKTGPGLPDIPPFKAEPPTILLPPVAVGEKPPPEPVDPNDPALRMIKDALNIKTTILDKPAPPPVVLADAKKDADPTTSPIPMTGPPPKLDLPPPEIRIWPAPPPMPSPQTKAVPLLNNRAVELDFEVTKSGLSKVKGVELWTTRDGGADWKQTDRMEGSRPPFRTRLGSEGEYGFRLVFVSEAGMRTPEPKPGQPPELRMELDTTPPTVQIYPPTAGPAGVIVLRWMVADKHLDRDPSAARLEYSADGQTWQPIELAARPADPGGLNHHEWRLPPGVPAKVLLRVTARDKAGNVGVAVTNEKMSVDLVAPEGKLTGVRVQGRGPEPGPMPHEAEAISSGDGPVEGVLRSALAALLNSPLLFPALIQPVFPILQPEAWDVSGNEAATAPPDTYQHDGSGWFSGGLTPIPLLKPLPFTAKAWVADLMKTDVVEERPAWTFQRRDPFAMPALGPDLQPIADPPPWTDNRFVISLAGCPSIYHRPLVRGWGRMTEQQFQGFLAEFPTTTTLGVLTDRDWQPSTARPDSYRCDGPAFADRPFGGTFDVGPGFWGTLPGGGVLLDF